MCIIKSYLQKRKTRIMLRLHDLDFSKRLATKNLSETRTKRYITPHLGKIFRQTTIFLYHLAQFHVYTNVLTAFRPNECWKLLGTIFVTLITPTPSKRFVPNEKIQLAKCPNIQIPNVCYVYYTVGNHFLDVCENANHISHP